MRLATRVSAFFLAALAAVLVGFSALLYVSAYHHLNRQVDERLSAGLAVLTAAAEIHPDGVEWEPDERKLPPGLDGGPAPLLWLVADEGGRVVDRSPILDDYGLALGATPRRWRLRDGRGQVWRIGRLRVGPGPKAARDDHEPRGRPWPRALVLTVAAPVGPVDATLAALGWSLAGSSLAVWLIAAFVGRGLVRRALAPLGRMVESARALDATDPGWTIPEAGTGDELDELGRAFNGLLARLHVAFERQRRFAADASHQLRTPLTALVGQIDVALRRDRPAEEYRRVLGLVRGQAGNLARIVEALLFLGRAEAEAGLPDAETIDLTSWVEAHVAGHPLARSIGLVLPDGPLPVRAHAALLGQVVDNLLDNAAKYGDPGATIRLRLQGEGGSATLSVEDHGLGIDPVDLPRLFEPFFRSERARRLGRPGVGLGLAIARRICTALGGSIAVDTEPGRGCRFTVTLPRSGDPTPIPEGRPAPSRAGQAVPDR